MKKTLVYIIAAVVAIGVAVGVIFMIKPAQNTTVSTMTPIETVSTPEPIEMVNIVVADQRIAAGAEITADMLSTMTVPITEKPAYAISNAVDAIGTTAIMNIEAGSTMLSVMVEHPHIYIADSQGLSYEIPEGFVALAIPVSDLDGVSGYLVPGDVVNALAPAKIIKAATSGIHMIEGDVIPRNQAYLVKNVTVLAVGDKAYDEYMAHNAAIVRTSTSIQGETSEGEEDQGSPTYDCVIVALDDYSAQIFCEVLKSSKVTLTLQHREYGVKNVTVPEIVPIDQEFEYLTEEETRANASVAVVPAE